MSHATAPDETVLEVLPTQQLGADVTRLIAERLAPTGVVSDDRLLEAVQGAIGEILGVGSQLLVLRRPDPELAPVMNAVLAQVPGAVRARRQALTQQHIDALADVYMASDPLSEALPDVERDNAEAQAAFLARWRVLTAEALAGAPVMGAGNRSATASRWKAAGRIFGLPAGRREVYPAFQFKDGRPRDVIARTMAALPGGMSAWQTAFWFIGPNSWLGDAAPVDRLDDPDAVVAAAGHEAGVWMG